jgi:hypothetical protein
MRLAAIAILAAVSLSGCLAYDVASTAVGVTTTVIGTAADVAGSAVCTIACSSDKDDKK